MSNKTKKKQVQNQAQEGRSMVEMLGVLAVIGVISIGGISGYRMAMNRYQANQIANEINLMRTDAKMKVAQGAEELLLGEPYDGEDGHLNFNANYGVEVGFEEIETETPGETETGYSFALSGIPAGVCKPLATLLDGMDDTAALEINGKNYETAENPCDNEENEVMVAFSTKDLGGETKCNPDKCEGKCTEAGECEPCPEEMPWNGSACACPSDKHWDGDACVGCSGGKWEEDSNECVCPEESHLKGDECITCPAEAPWSDTERDCVCSDGNKHWTGYQCVDCGGREWDEENKECKCDEGKYWSDSAGKCIENPCNKNGQGCAADEFCLSSSCGGCSSYDSSGSGTITENCSTHSCKKISEYKADNQDSEHPNKYVMSKSSMNWWSAERFCKALPGNRHMLTISDLNCKNTSLGGTTTGCCYAKEGSGSELSDVIKALRKAENGTETSGSLYYWLYNSYTSTTAGRNSCYAYYVLLSNGYVSNNNRNTFAYALCE